MAYTPTLSDIPQYSGGYTPTLADIPISPASQPNTPKHSLLGDVGHFIQGGLQGVSDLGHGIASLGDRGLNALLGTHLQAPQGNVFAFNPQAANTMPAKIGNIAGQIGAMAAVPTFAEGLLPSLGEGALQGGAYGAVQAANNPKSSIGLGAGIGAALGAPGEAFGNMIGNYMRGLASKAGEAGSRINTPQEVQKIAQLTGQPTDFGSLVGSKGLSNLANKVLPNMGLIPFISNKGMKAVQEAMKNQTDTAADSLLNGLRGGVNPEDIPESLRKAISGNLNNYKSTASDMYDAVSNSAKNRGVRINDFSNLKNALNDINDEGSLLPESSGFLNKLKKLVPEAESDGQQYSKTNEKYDPVHTLSKQASNYSGTNYSSNAPLSRQYSIIGSALKKDLQNGLSSSGNGDLVTSLNKANQYYKDNVVPYNDNVVRGIINGNKDVESLPNRLKQSQVSTVVGHLSDDDQNRLGYQLLSKKALEEDKKLGTIQTSPQKLMGAYNSLSPSVRSRLFSPENINNFDVLRAQLGTQQSLRDALSPAGNDLNKIVKKGAIKFAPSIASTVTGISSPHLIAPLWAGSNIAARLGNKLLRSEALRNAYLNPATSALVRANELAGLLRYPAIAGANNIINGGQG